MSVEWVLALVFGAVLLLPLVWTGIVTVRAFTTSPMVAIVSAKKRAAAAWIIWAAVIYAQVVGSMWLAKLPTAVAALLTPALLVVFGVGPCVWWFVSRQAHALFDLNTFVPAFILAWSIRRAVAQYLRARPEGELGVRVNGSDLVIGWLPDQQTVRFTFDSRGQASRLWASIYALSPDTDQVCRLVFARRKDDDRPRAKLFFTD